MLRLTLMYGAIHINGLFLSLFLLGRIQFLFLIMLQVVFLLVMLWDLTSYKHFQKEISWKKRSLWLLRGLIFMVCLGILLSLLYSKIATNQRSLLMVQNNVPWVSFVLFLFNASVIEEYVYRELVWEKLSNPFSQVLLSSVLFALAHYPATFPTWVMYGGLGLAFGLVRLKTDCLTTILLHLIWNGLVYFLSIL